MASPIANDATITTASIAMISRGIGGSPRRHRLHVSQGSSSAETDCPNFFPQRRQNLLSFTDIGHGSEATETQNDFMAAIMSTRPANVDGFTR